MSNKKLVNGERIGFMLDAELLAQTKELAWQERMNLSAFIRKCIRHYMMYGRTDDF